MNEVTDVSTLVVRTSHRPQEKYFADNYNHWIYACVCTHQHATLVQKFVSFTALFTPSSSGLSPRKAGICPATTDPSLMLFDLVPSLGRCFFKTSWKQTGLYAWEIRQQQTSQLVTTCPFDCLLGQGISHLGLKCHSPQKAFWGLSMSSKLAVWALPGQGAPLSSQLIPASLWPHLSLFWAVCPFGGLTDDQTLQAISRVSGIDVSWECLLWAGWMHLQG